jgi:hypothetical protein
VVVKAVRALALFAFALTGCSREATPSRDTAVTATAVSQSPAAAGTCPRTGHWGDCQLRARLAQAGLAPRTAEDDVGDLPKLDIAPIKLRLGNAGLAFYLYPDSTARKRAAAGLDTNRYIPQAKPVSMKGETTLIQNDNVLVLLFSKNDHQRERVSDAVTAGPPQP